MEAAYGARRAIFGLSGGRNRARRTHGTACLTQCILVPPGGANVARAGRYGGLRAAHLALRAHRRAGLRRVRARKTAVIPIVMCMRFV
jgi:hypothetical protein